MCNFYGTIDAHHLHTMLFVKNVLTSYWDMTVAPLKRGHPSARAVVSVHRQQVRISYASPPCFFGSKAANI